MERTARCLEFTEFTCQNLDEKKRKKKRKNDQDRIIGSYWIVFVKKLLVHSFSIDGFFRRVSEAATASWGLGSILTFLTRGTIAKHT